MFVRDFEDLLLKVDVKISNNCSVLVNGFLFYIKKSIHSVIRTVIKNLIK